MITLKNPTVSSEWIIDLKLDPRVENALPLTGLNVRNDSNIIAYVDLDGLKVGEVQRYSADPFQGRNFSLIRIYNPDGQDFAVDDIFIQATKGEMVASQPFNPQWDTMAFDLDRYATGCNSRVSLSSVVTADMVKYWLNTQNGLAVQRKLDVLGGAAVGDYEISFGGANVLTGSTAIDFPSVDTMQYRKTISGGVFDYTLTNCTLKAWVYDCLLNPNDRAYTVEDDPGNGVKGFDDDMSTATDWDSTVGFLGAGNDNGGACCLELSFDETDITEFHMNYDLKHVVGFTGCAYAALLIDSVWTWIASGSVGVGETNVSVHDLTARAKVGGVKLMFGNCFGGGNTTYARVRDVAIF